MSSTKQSTPIATDPRPTPESPKPPGLVADLLACLRSLPNRYPFLAMFVAWILLFHFLGNSVLGYIDTKSLFAWWLHVCKNSEEDQLCFLIPPLVIVLLWLRRGEWLPIDKQPSTWPMILLVTGLLLHLSGFVVQQTRVSILGFIVGLFGIAGTVWGPRFLRQILYPYGLLVFAIPLGAVSDSLTSPLRLLVSVLSAGFANHVLGLDVLRMGSLLYDSQGTYQYDIAPACSGIRSLTALLLLMTVYAFLNFRTIWRRTLIILLAAPLAVLGNTLRIIIVIIAGELYGQSAGASIETNLGFLTFALAVGAMLLLGWWLREPDQPESQSSPASDPNIRSLGRIRSGWWPQACTAIGLMVLMALFLLKWSGHQKLGTPGVRVADLPLIGIERSPTGSNQTFDAAPHSVDLPTVVLDYTSEAEPVSKTVLDYLPADTIYGQRRYTSPDRVTLFNNVVLMGKDRTSIHRPELCLSMSGWKIEKSEETQINIDQPHPYQLPVRKLSLRRSVPDGRGGLMDLSAVAVYWFVADGYLTASHPERMWLQARELILRGELQRWAYVICYSPCYPGQEAGVYQRMTKFLAASVPQYQLTVGQP